MAEATSPILDSQLGEANHQLDLTIGIFGEAELTFDVVGELGEPAESREERIQSRQRARARFVDGEDLAVERDGLFRLLEELVVNSRHLGEEAFLLDGISRLRHAHSQDADQIAVAPRATMKRLERGEHLEVTRIDLEDLAVTLDGAVHVTQLLVFELGGLHPKLTREHGILFGGRDLREERHERGNFSCSSAIISSRASAFSLLGTARNARRRSECGSTLPSSSAQTCAALLRNASVGIRSSRRALEAHE